METRMVFSNLRRTAGKLFRNVGFREEGAQTNLNSLNTAQYEVVTFLNQSLNAGVNNIIKSIASESTVEEMAHLFRHAHTLGFLKCDVAVLTCKRGFQKGSFYVYLHEESLSKKVYLEWVIHQVGLMWGVNLPIKVVTDCQYVSDTRVNPNELNDLDHLSLYYQLISFGVDVYPGNAGKESAFLIK
ncbi:hypothetical protein 2050HW_00338 [Serratia phage vB_SmaM_ 2050HW]|uniref:Uncharacterized protein n=1 Tax=Serratia phage vB_SmaM_ 2050HW TaxID=2024252 RepID=A0A289ZTX8_9CAUD|nr:hypothetical protein HWB23_gp338 [Serratia phage vB_SmaM_ 2050HW]ATA65673.1 hypothetical protein 2050HW_00338 [Serratia phage vB_SmaM_ 2050HW]UCR74603.1 hypothetical protein [Serratia phage BUCT660]URG14171.1 hypothetical protein [Pectobacterium phage vB_ParM-25]